MKIITKSFIRRQFCSYPNRVLARTLEKEMKYERTLDTEIPFVENFLSSTQFMYKADESVAMVLEKQNRDLLIQIQFYMRIPTIRQGADPTEIEPVEPEIQDSSEFVIGIHKENSLSLYLECISTNSSVLINNILYHKPVQNFRKLFKNRDLHRVNFNFLSPSLQLSIVNWLLSIGINEDIGKFCEIESYSHERKLYKRWLDQMSSYITESLED